MVAPRDGEIGDFVRSDRCRKRVVVNGCLEIELGAVGLSSTVKDASADE